MDEENTPDQGTDQQETSPEETKEEQDTQENPEQVEGESQASIATDEESGGSGEDSQPA